MLMVLVCGGGGGGVVVHLVAVTDDFMSNIPVYVLLYILVVRYIQYRNQFYPSTNSTVYRTKLYSKLCAICGTTLSMLFRVL